MATETELHNLNNGTIKLKNNVRSLITNSFYINPVSYNSSIYILISRLKIIIDYDTQICHCQCCPPDIWKLLLFVGLQSYIIIFKLHLPIIHSF